MAHEDLGRERYIKRSSDRVFGLVFAGLFLLIACWPLSKGEPARWWSAGTGAAFALTALIRPALLGRLNRLWAQFGILLGSVISPLALWILFYGVIAPMGLAMRLAGKSPLRLAFDRSADSYWIPRNPPGPPPGSMNNQF